jgi:hypothetical protein
MLTLSEVVGSAWAARARGPELAGGGKPAAGGGGAAPGVFLKGSLGEGRGAARAGPRWRRDR